MNAFHSTQNNVDNGDMEGAASGYKEMLSLYNQIVASGLDPMHKELAYDQLVKVYQALKNPPANTFHATTHIIAAAALLVLFSFLVFFKPTIFGLTTAEPHITHDLNWAFVDSGAREVHLDAMPKSVKLSGKVDGGGFVRVYAVTPHSRVLLFDNDFVRTSGDGEFTNACVHTCTAGLESQDFTIDVIVENAALTLYSIEYTT